MYVGPRVCLPNDIHRMAAEPIAAEFQNGRYQGAHQSDIPAGTNRLNPGEPNTSPRGQLCEPGRACNPHAN